MLNDLGMFGAYQSVGQVELRLKDADGFILFDNECDGFTEVGLSELPCSYWDAKK